MSLRDYLLHISEEIDFIRRSTGVPVSASDLAGCERVHNPPTLNHPIEPL